jgi:hypothetical protein
MLLQQRHWQLAGAAATVPVAPGRVPQHPPGNPPPGGCRPGRRRWPRPRPGRPPAAGNPGRRQRPGPGPLSGTAQARRPSVPAAGRRLRGAQAGCLAAHRRPGRGHGAAHAGSASPHEPEVETRPAAPQAPRQLDTSQEPWIPTSSRQPEPPGGRTGTLPLALACAPAHAASGTATAHHDRSHVQVTGMHDAAHGSQPTTKINGCRADSLVPVNCEVELSEW